MSDRPTRLWREMPPEKRVAAALAFWRDTDSPDIAVQHAEAIGLLARRLNFRVRSLQGLPVERRARHLAQVGEVTDAVATRALIAYHFETQRALMAAFLDALGLEHDNGLITAEDVSAPPSSALASAVQAVRAAFPPEDVDLYLRTLAALDGDTWNGLDQVLADSQT
jgi:hypothetical protein